MSGEFVAVDGGDVRPGDVYRFTSYRDGRHFYADVVAVEGHMVQVRYWDKRLGTRWVTKKPHKAGWVVFARKREPEAAG